MNENFQYICGCGQFLNLNEAIDLLDAISNFNFKDVEKIPNFSIWDKQKDGYVLCVKANSVTEEYRDYLKGIVESRKLRMRELDGYLMIHG